MIYLLCFDRPLAHARHYIGFSNDPEAREKRHYRGGGAKILRAAREAGITWQVMCVWQGSRTDERRFKNRKSARHYCPRCAGPRVREVKFLEKVVVE